MESTIKLLIIDDDEIDRMQLKRSLRNTEFNCDIIECEDTQRVIEVVSSQSFDCIFLDYLLPGDDGLSLLKKIRDKGIRTPIVIITSQGSESIAVELMKAGASDYIIKNEINGHYIGQVLRNMLRVSKIERERELAIRAKEISESRLAEAQRIAKIGNWEVNVFDGTIYLSPQVYNIFEIDPIIYTPTLQTIEGGINFVHQEDRHSFLRAINLALVEGKPLNLDYRIVTPSGIKYTNIQGYALINSDKVAYKIIGTIQDITERKLAEREILKARELAEHSMKAREVFLANMSHEIRTPMNAILGFTRLLYDTNLSEEQKSFLDAINFSGENLLVIINDILDLSKIQSGKMTFEKVEFNLNDLLKGVNTIFKQKAAEKGLQFTCQIKQQVPHMVKGDPVRLNQVLTNLISNAIKFTEKGFVHLEVQSNNLETGKHLIDFKVTDTGIGIPLDKQGKIFESFEQATSDTTRKYGGTGLGLTIVKSIIELQEGNISLLSEPGKGSAFTVNLTFDQAEPSLLHKEQEAIEESTHNLRGASILVVEDNAVNQLLVKKVLQKFGCKIDIAFNGMKAIESLKTSRYDLILMDIQMPEMDGYEATRIIRSNFPSPMCDIPIIAMTAHAFASEVEKCKEAGMNDYMSKPFKQDILFNMLCKYIPEKEDPKIIPLHQRQEMTTHIIDLAPLYELAKSDEEFITAIVRVYDKQTQKFSERLRDALRSHDFETIKAICHQIRGSYGMLRMNELRKNLDEIDVIFLNDRPKSEFTKINYLINNIISLISAVNEEVKRKLRQTA